MSINDYTTTPKLGVEKMITEALDCNCIISNPIEHYSMDEIIQIANLAAKHDLLFTIKEERSNFYQGVMISLIKKTKIEECKHFIKHL